MRTYPKFLKSMPTFLGLSPVDLIGLGLGLFMSLILGLTPITSFVVAMSLMTVSKMVRTYFDVVGFLLPQSKRLTLRGDWRDNSI